MADEITRAKIRALLATIDEARHHLMDARSASADLKGREESLDAADNLLGRAGDEAGNGFHFDDVDMGVGLTTEFVREANHAIRGPLGAAVGHLDLLQDRSTMTEEQQGQSISAAWVGTRMADRFVQEFFDIANAWTKRAVTPVLPVSVAALMGEVLDMAEAHAKSRRITITRTIGADVRRLRVDPDGFQEMVEIMVEHAVDAAPMGSDVEVEVRPGKETMRVEVTHSGNCGWSPKDHFKPFEPAEIGAAIGLTPLRELARLRAGNAAVEAREVGENIWFEVPDWQESKHNAPLTEKETTMKESPGEGSRVLIVEDDRNDMEVLQAMLVDAGYHVDMAVNVDTGVSLVERFDYDAITLDLLLGRSYSMRVLAAARNGRNKDTAILVLSATRPGNVIFPFPVQAHLQKPVKKRVLLRALRWGGVPPPIGGPVLILAAEPLTGLESAVLSRGRRFVHVTEDQDAVAALEDDPSVFIIGPDANVSQRLFEALQDTAIILCGEPQDAPDGLRGRAAAIVDATPDLDLLLEQLDWIVQETSLSVEGSNELQ